jgi:hypothetical protein
MDANEVRSTGNNLVPQARDWSEAEASEKVMCVWRLAAEWTGRR